MRKVLERKIVAILLVSSLFIAILLLPIVFYHGSRVDMSQIHLPGIPINETLFNEAVSSENNSGIFHGDFELMSRSPYVLKFLPETGLVITEEEAINLAIDFIPERYSFRLNRIHWIRLMSGIPMWIIRFTEDLDELVVLVYLHAITGRVVSYHVHWDPAFDYRYSSPPLNPDGSPSNRSVIETCFVQYLKDNEFYLTENMRLIDSMAYPNETDAIDYRIRIAMPNEKVLSDEFIEGIEARIDAITGEVQDFRFIFIQIPDIDTSGVINPEIIYDDVIELAKNQYYENLSHISTFLRLKTITSSFNATMTFQLVWAFLFRTEGGWLTEVLRDATNGGNTIPNPNIII